MPHIVDNGLVTLAQHGLIKNRSYLKNLLIFLNETTRRMNEGVAVEICYLDLSKAFDSVSYFLLDHKLPVFGIDGLTGIG